MKTNASSVGSKPADVFKTFPEFSKLTFADREKYQKLTAHMPPACSSSFFNLMTWWNTLDTAAVAVLNGNLILSYWLPGDAKRSGLSILGDRKLDETICAIFDYLRASQEKVRLVHVPEHVLKNLRYPELFRCSPVHSDDEYVMSVAQFYPLANIHPIKRFRAKKFMARHPETSIQLKYLDLDLEENRLLLSESIEYWQEGSETEDFVAYMDDALRISMENWHELDARNVCLFVDGELQAFLIYFYTQDKRYVTLGSAHFSNQHANLFDYALYMFGQHFSDRGVSFVNANSDLGLSSLRMTKLAMGPDHYFRHFTIEPA